MENNVIRIVNSIYNSNTYIIHNYKYDYVWLVDCGDVKPIKEWLKVNNKTVKGVFLTHTHFDHIYGLQELEQLYPDIIVYTSREGVIGLKSEKYNMSKYHNASYTYDSGNISILEDRFNVEIFSSHYMMVYYTPGHDWSCLTYKFENIIFTGDSYIPNIKTVTTFPKSDKIKNKESMNLIHTLLGEGVLVYSGHTI